MKWCRLWCEFAHDPKIQILPESMQRRFVMLMCFQTEGVIPGLTNAELAHAMNISPAKLEATRKLFLERNLIKDDWTLKNFEKRQFLSDHSTYRVRKHRSKNTNEIEENETLHDRFGNVTETPPDTDTDTDNIYICDRVKIPYKEIADTWNKFAVENGLRQITELTPKRKEKVSARWKHNGWGTIEFIASLFDRIKSNPFYLGKNNSGWKIDFDFIFKSDDNVIKILESTNQKTRSLLANKDCPKCHGKGKYFEDKIAIPCDCAGGTIGS